MHTCATIASAVMIMRDELSDRNQERDEGENKTDGAAAAMRRRHSPSRHWSLLSK